MSCDIDISGQGHPKSIGHRDIFQCTKFEGNGVVDATSDDAALDHAV